MKNINENNLRKAFWIVTIARTVAVAFIFLVLESVCTLCSESVSVLLSSISDAVKRPFPSSLPVLIARREKSEKKLCCSEQK